MGRDRGVACELCVRGVCMARATTDGPARQPRAGRDHPLVRRTCGWRVHDACMTRVTTDGPALQHGAGRDRPLARQPGSSYDSACRMRIQPLNHYDSNCLTCTLGGIVVPLARQPGPRSHDHHAGRLRLLDARRVGHGVRRRRRPHDRLQRGLDHGAVMSCNVM